MPECPGCREWPQASEQYIHDSWEYTRTCPSCRRDLDLPRDEEEVRQAERSRQVEEWHDERRRQEREDRVRAALRDKTCIECGGARSRLFALWTIGTECEACGAPHCRRCSTRTEGRWAHSWTYLCCGHSNYISQYSGY